MILRPYTSEDAATILSWCRDERAFYQWTAGVLGDWPISAEQFDSVLGEEWDCREMQIVNY